MPIFEDSYRAWDGTSGTAGATIDASCDSCHSIVAQGPSDDLTELETDINGLEFEHPVEIGGVWQNIKCTQCHTPAQGY